MMHSIFKRVVIFAGVLFFISCSNKESTPNTVENPPLSIIFMIGDGMGVPQISTAYYFGDKQSNFSEFQHIGFHKTSDKSHNITDSAAGATAFSTGQKTYKRALGVSVDTLPQESILESLQKRDYQTGLISLTSITHATPAAFYAHVKDRDMHQEIAAQLVGSNIDFFAGGGRKFFRDREDNRNLFNELKTKKYHLDTLKLSNVDYNKPNAFLLADDALPAKIEGRDDFLKQATTKALDYFDKNKKPFFLMIEGSFIDWGGHAENEEMVITEVEDFDQTLGMVLDFVENHPNTLLIVTADHETGGISIGKYYETDANGKKIEVPEKVSVNFNTNQHTGELIPVFAIGKGAENFQGIYENNEIYHKIQQALNKGK